MAGTVLEWENTAPLYLSERDVTGQWEVNADASFTLCCRNISTESVVIGAGGIGQIQLLLPITRSKGQEADKDITAEEYAGGISGECSQSGLTVRKGGITEDSCLSFYLEAGADYELAAGADIEVAFHHVQAYCPRESVSHVRCVYQDENMEEVLTPVFKKRSPLEIRKFQADASAAGMGDEITITWETLGADNWQLLPFAADLRSPAGSRKLRIWESGRLYLMIRRGEEGRQEYLDIQITDGQAIKSLTASAEKAGNNEVTTFKWELENARHAYLTNGIGNVDGEQVTRRLYTCNGNYVLYCLTKEEGKDTLISKAVSAGNEGVLEIAALDFQRTGASGQKSQYSLTWFVYNCSDIRLITSDGEERSKGSSMGSISFEGSHLSLEIICKGYDEQKIHLTQIKPEGEEL